MTNKPVWKQIDNCQGNKPSARWGHSSCCIGDQTLFFGGYADSQYMNDLWKYNPSTQQWRQIQTSGDLPLPRSNCTMNYDPVNNQIILFGGGGFNKQRFNTISLLDWNSKEWIEICPASCEENPWERTYHVAEFKFPYLIVFGGQAIADLDDLWIFSFIDLSWKEIKFQSNEAKPSARRFHSSCMINNQLFIIGGCHSKYRCLNDIYSLDLTQLIEKGNYSDLKWKQIKLKQPFVARWGHSSSVYNNKIYVFAGRFSNDLKDIVVIDPLLQTSKTIYVPNSNMGPKPRRRHCAVFQGSCLVIFGGFNGEYFNDLYYINLIEVSNKLDNSIFHNKNYLFEEFQGETLKSSEGEQIMIHLDLIKKYFKCREDFQIFCNQMNGNISSSEIKKAISCLYDGYGSNNLLIDKNIDLPQKMSYNELVKNIFEIEEQSSTFKIVERQSSHLVVLEKQQFKNFLEKTSELWYLDSLILLPDREIRVNKKVLSMASPYFKNIFSEKYRESRKEEYLHLSKDYGCVIDIFLNYLLFEALIVPSNFEISQWKQLCEMAAYFTVNKLEKICQFELTQKITENSLEELLLFSEEMKLSKLALSCTNFELKICLKQKNTQQKMDKLKESKRERQRRLYVLFQNVKFDYWHNMVEKSIEELPSLSKKNSQKIEKGKQNKQNKTNNVFNPFSSNGSIFQ